MGRIASGLASALTPQARHYLVSKPIIFSVDQADRIASVNREWTRFAQANGGAAVLPARVLGQELWTQIADETVQEIYRLMLSRARAGFLVRFSYRCDSPSFRRTFTMTVSLRKSGWVQFASLLTAEEARPPVVLLEGVPRDQRMITVCSWCQRVRLTDGTWVPVEEAVERMQYLQAASFPRVTHGICLTCMTGVLEQLAKPG